MSICSGSYAADKDKLDPIDLSQIQAHELLRQYLECGLESVSTNGWFDVAGLSPRQIMEHISKVEVVYAESIPQELLPNDSQGRKTAAFHQVKDGHWQILIAGSEFKMYYPGERYLLLFHELISTLDPQLDLNFGATIDFEFKALQKNSAAFQALKVSNILLPKLGLGNSYTKLIGPITSGGGDGTLIWLKRQLRNYMIDTYVVPLMRGTPTLTSIQLEKIFQAISYCPMDLTEKPTASYRVLTSEQGAPMLSVDRSFFHRDYEKFLSISHDSKDAAMKASQSALSSLGDLLKDVAPIWAKACVLTP